MDNFASALNDNLMETYHSIVRLEQEALRRLSSQPLSINEMFLIECVGKQGDEGMAMSEIAAALEIARPSATAAVSKLEKKGYVLKAGCSKDGRMVRVYLTREGKKILAGRCFYHRTIIRRLTDSFDDTEKECLMEAVRRLNLFFKESIEALK